MNNINGNMKDGWEEAKKTRVFLLFKNFKKLIGVQHTIKCIILNVELDKCCHICAFM